MRYERDELVGYDINKLVPCTARKRQPETAVDEIRAQHRHAGQSSLQDIRKGLLKSRDLSVNLNEPCL